MAQRIIGLDLGSRNIRVSIVETTLRTVELAGVDVEPVLQIPDAALVPARHRQKVTESYLTALGVSLPLSERYGDRLVQRQ